MERGELFKTSIPDFATLTKEDERAILSDAGFEQFLDLQNPEIRRVDTVWARVLFGEQGRDVLDSALDLLQRKATSRNR